MTNWCTCFSVVIFLPINLNRGHQQTHQNRPHKEPDEDIECQPAEDAEYEEERGDLDRLSDQRGSKKLIDHRHDADSPSQHDQRFPQRTGHEEFRTAGPHTNAVPPKGSGARITVATVNTTGNGTPRTPLGQPCQETLNDRSQAYPLHHGANGLIQAIHDPLLM